MAVNHSYDLSLDIDPAQGFLEGEERISVRNPFAQSFDKVILTLDFNIQGSGKETQIKAVKHGSGAGARFDFPSIGGKVDRSYLVVALEKELKPNSELELIVEFLSKFPKQADGLPTMLEDTFYESSSYYPRVIGHAEGELRSSKRREFFSASYRVRATVPEDQVVASSGKVLKEEVSGAKKTLHLEAYGTRGFGLVMSPRFEVKSGSFQKVEVNSYSLPGGEERSSRLLEAAGEALNFYARDIGFYPWNNLAILPGSEFWVGGYASSNMAFIHGREPAGSGDKLGRIVAHEIAHQYWGAYVGDPIDYPKWLTIGMSHWMDERFERSKDKNLRRKPWKRYLAGIALGVDTTIMQPIEKLEGAKFDWNGIIAHSKAYTVIKMLESLVGPYTFEKVVASVLERYGGKIVTAKDFARACQRVSGQRLDWFFDQWLYTDKKLDYRVTDQAEAEVEKGVHMLRLRVKRFGDAKMPLKIGVAYKDGSFKVDGIKEDTLEAELVFTGSSPKEKVIVDPDDILPLKSKVDELEPEILGYAFFDAGRYAEAERKLKEALRANPSDAEAHFTLGLCLYEEKDYAGAIEAFQKASELETGKARKAWSKIWTGHVLDLEGRRSEAIACYKEAASLGSTERVRFDRYGIDADATSWVAKRLESPYARV
ncbi:MAG: tetratricopeptide repeat protein [Thermoproteota archaeon]